MFTVSLSSYSMSIMNLNKCLYIMMSSHHIHVNILNADNINAHQQKKRLLQMDMHCVRTQEIRLEHPVRPARPQMAPAQWLHPSPLSAIQPASCPPSAPGWSISLPNLPNKPRVSDP